MEGLESLLKFGIALMVVILIVVLIIYVAVSLFLNKFHKLVYGKGTFLVWIPFFGIQSYFLGKLAFNKAVGWVLVLCNFLFSETTVLGVKIPSLPKNIREPLSTVYFLAEFGLLIYAIIKYNKIKKQVMAGDYSGVNTVQQIPTVPPVPTVPNGPMNQTDPFAMGATPATPYGQNPMPMQPNQMGMQPNQMAMGPNVVGQPMMAPAPPEPAPTPAPQNPKFEPDVTIDSIIHHAEDSAPTDSVEQLNEEPVPTPVDTNNPNNM